TSLIVFDASGRVVATSQAADAGLVGRVAGEEWVRRTLAQDNSQHYAVSAFAPSPLYGGRHTYIYGAAIHAPDSNRVVGGIGIVFDSAPQFAAMLQDALPHDESGRVIDGSFAVFADREGHVVACSDERYAPGARLAIDSALLNQPAGSSHAAIAALEGRYYAIGSRMSAGYREYKGPGDSYRNPISALVFVPLCDAVARRQRDEARRLAIRSDRGGEGETVEISTFSIGSSWFGIPSTQVVEAVDRTGLAGVPGAGCDFAGYLMYRGVPIPIFEIGAIANAGLPPANGRSQVIVLRRGENNYFGIQVDSLGEIPEIATTRLRPLPPMLAGGNVLGEAIVSTDAPKEEQLLLVLSVERIAAKLSLNNLEPPPGTIAISARRETVAA
ncbi:MAG TPA: chemotaxis protein CheW, partial [Rhodocyclaceae bacterium]